MYYQARRVICRLRRRVKIPTNMWDDRPAATLGTGLPSGLHVGKVWRDQTDTLSVPARIPADNVAAGPRFRPPRRHPREAPPPRHGTHRGLDTSRRRIDRLHFERRENG